MIHLVLGYQGSGKTLYLVKKAHEAFRRGKNIYSNIHLNFPYNPIDYNDIIECRYENAVVLIDEAHLLLPARASLQKTSRIIVDNFLSMVRKKNLEVYATTQTERKIDVRFREEADYIYYAEKYAYKKRWGKVLHNQDLPLKVPIKIKLKVIQTLDNAMITLSFDGNQYFRMYDSKQIIKVKGI